MAMRQTASDGSQPYSSEQEKFTDKENTNMPHITLDQAEAVLAGAKAAALELGKAFSFSVVAA